MKKIWRIIPTVVFLLCLFGTPPVVAAEQQEQQKVENPYEGARVIVSAFVVDVKLAALEKAGAGPFEKEATSATKILDILKSKDAGRIKATATLAVMDREDGEMTAKSTTWVPVSDGKDPNGQIRTSTRLYETGTTFRIDLAVKPDGQIRLGYDLVLTIIEEGKNDFLPPDTPRYAWRSQASLRSGTPVIASALEEKDKITYLILRADIEKDSLAEKKK